MREGSSLLATPSPGVVVRRREQEATRGLDWHRAGPRWRPAPSTGLLLVAGYGLYKGRKLNRIPQRHGRRPDEHGVRLAAPVHAGKTAPPRRSWPSSSSFSPTRGGSLPGKLSRRDRVRAAAHRDRRERRRRPHGGARNAAHGPGRNPRRPHSPGDSSRGRAASSSPLRWFELYVLHAGREKPRLAAARVCPRGPCGRGALLHACRSRPASSLCSSSTSPRLPAPAWLPMRAEQTPAPSLVNQLSPSKASRAATC